MDLQKEREALIAEIEVFKAEMLKSYVIKAWADSYVNTDPFSYAIFEDENNKIWWMKAQTHEFWRIWQAAKAQAVPEGFVLVPKENIFCYWQDNDEPENLCSNESDFDCLGDLIDLGEIMEINKFTQAHVDKEKLFGTWFAEAIDPSERANFFVGTHEECMAIVEKNKAMIEAQEQAND